MTSLIHNESTEIQSSPIKRRLRSASSTPETPVSSPPEKWKSRRKSVSSTPNGKENGVCNVLGFKTVKSPRKRLADSFTQRPKWNPKDSGQMGTVKEALHVSMSPQEIVGREEEQKRVLEFCKSCIQEEKASSLYVCGCPGTGKTLSMEKVKNNLLNWTKEAGFPQPIMLTVNCTSLGNTREIFNKILGTYQPRKKVNGVTALQHLQKLFSQKKESSR